ncbi:hypothetical protein [Rhodococcus sp. 077-4]|uniref:hypothetical protein n=1 Tax=Rhodococcus sp. 077-4 TaxID=2789271 RepID=UPI0039F5A2F7
MIKSRTAAAAGAIASVVAIVVTAFSSDLVRTTLSHAYSYPNATGLELDEATSMTMTYLFAVAGAGLVISALYLCSRPVARSRWGWYLGGVVAALGLVVASYNATQEFPVAVKLVYFLPVIAGALWVTSAKPGQSAPVAAAR